MIEAPPNRFYSYFLPQVLSSPYGIVPNPRIDPGGIQRTFTFP